MNNLILANQNLTMSSREIATLTGKQHKDVLHDIRKMLIDLELNTADFSAVYKADNGQEYMCFNLDKENTLILVSGYNVKIRQAIIKRWQELENQQPKPKQLTNRELALMVIQEADRADKAEATVKRLIHSGRCHTTRQLAKEAGFKSAQELNAVLFNSKIIFKERGIWVLYAKYADKGYQEIKQQEFDNGHIGYTAEWTAKGREFVLNFCEGL